MDDNIVVIAERPEELVAAQNALCDNIGSKIAVARGEASEAEELLNIVRNAGLSDGAAKRGLDRAKSRVVFLCKVQEALAAGYVIMPDMPAEVIAIRVKRAPATTTVETSNWHEIVGKAQSLPAGEGEFADPKLPVTREYVESDRTQMTTPTGEWDFDFGLPMMFLKPRIVRRTGDAMTQRIFDEIAITPTPATKQAMRRVESQPVGATPDPMVIGRIIDRATKKRMCFLIAWFVDTSTI
jgi:hypothetical protein